MIKGGKRIKVDKESLSWKDSKERQLEREKEIVKERKERWEDRACEKGWKEKKREHMNKVDKDRKVGRENV